MTSGRWEVQGNQQLPGPKYRAPRSGAKVFYRDIAGATRSGYAAGSVKRNQQRHGVRAWRGVTQVAANGSSSLDLCTANKRCDLGQCGIGARNSRVSINSVARNRAAKGESLRRIEMDGVQLGNAFDIDDEIGFLASCPKLHQQIRASSQQARAGMGRHQPESFAHRRRRGVIKPLHWEILLRTADET